MNPYTDAQILQGILDGDHKVLNFLYDQYYGKVERYFLARGGHPEHIKDVFQEAIIVIYQKISNSALELSCAFSTYLFAVCINIWKHDLRKRRYRLVEEDQLDTLQEEAVPDHEIHQKMEQLFKTHFSQLSPDCQRLLNMHFRKVPLAEIREKMGYSSEQYASDRKYRCKQSLYNRIRRDPEFRKLTGHG